MKKTSIIVKDQRFNQCSTLRDIGFDTFFQTTASDEIFIKISQDQTYIGIDEDYVENYEKSEEIVYCVCFLSKKKRRGKIVIFETSQQVIPLKNIEIKIVK